MKRDTAVDVLICQSFSKICKREKSKLVDYSDLNVTALFRTTSPSVSHYQRFHLLKLFPFIICCCAAVRNPTHLFHSLNFLIYLSTEVTNFHLSNPMQPVEWEGNTEPQCYKCKLLTYLLWIILNITAREAAEERTEPFEDKKMIKIQHMDANPWQSKKSKYQWTLYFAPSNFIGCLVNMIMIIK